MANENIANAERSWNFQECAWLTAIGASAARDAAQETGPECAASLTRADAHGSEQLAKAVSHGGAALGFSLERSPDFDQNSFDEILFVRPSIGTNLKYSFKLIGNFSARERGQLLSSLRYDVLDFRVFFGVHRLVIRLLLPRSPELTYFRLVSTTTARLCTIGLRCLNNWRRLLMKKAVFQSSGQIAKLALQGVVADGGDVVSRGEQLAEQMGGVTNFKWRGLQDLAHLID